jgi:acetyl coenzyme A synthetase (ADP forming)-like protein
MTPNPAAPASRDSDAPPNPAHLVLRGGATIQVRPVRPDDEARLLAFLRSLSPESRVLRFAGTLSDDGLRREAARVARGEAEGAFGLVATLGAEEEIVGHAEYDPTRGDAAEVALVVADRWQGQGIGTILLGQLAEIASQHGLRTFTAVCLPHNHRMIRVFRESGFPVRVQAGAGEVSVEFPTEITEEARERFEERDRLAAVSALRSFFAPRSVAVIGASRDRGAIGSEVLHNLLALEFRGPVFPVNPKATALQGVLAYPSVTAVPGPVDLAVIVVPARQVLAVAEECAGAGVRALLVLSAGFGETGAEGKGRQEELLRICRASGMRLIGPNCMGILSTDPAVRLNATFAPTPPEPGRIGFMSQSGALGLAILDYANILGLGLSSFASVGNKADLSGNDLIRYWEQDENTDVILLYLESFGNPRNFSRIARRVSRSKPIVAVKSGRSAVGARATQSHTGALIAASDVSVDALFRQTGVIRTNTLQETFDVAALLSCQPVPRGRRVAIVTNGGGPGILCADACVAEGLEIPALAEETQAALRAILPAEASVANPVDMIASATPEQFREAIRLVGADPSIDALIVIFVPPLVTRPDEVAAAMLEGARSLERRVPVLSVFMQAHGVPEALRSPELRVPSFAFPENAAIALSRVARYGEWLARPALPPASFPDVRPEEAAAIVATALGRGEGWLRPDEVAGLLSCYGLPTLEERVAPTPGAAAEAAAALGAKVALKAIAPGLVHKSDAGAVRLHLASEQVEAAAAGMEESLRAAGVEPTGYLVQRMAPTGVEMIVGVVNDPHFGPLVACGAGGVLVELLKDASVRLAPLSEHDAREMVEELKMYPLLTGYRGSPAGDVEAFEAAIARVGMMVDALPQIVELDLNPIVVHSTGVTIVDARVRVAAATPAPLLPTRR